MRTLIRRRPILAVALAGVLLGCGGDDAAGPSNPLVDQWVATKWEFTNQANTSEKFDLVAEGVTVTLTINASTYSILYVIPGSGSQTVTGTWTQSGNQFTIVENGSSDPETVTFAFSNGNNTLTLSTPDTNWDFDDDGTDDPATLSVTLTRQ